jgi:hypothetical protein
MRSLARRARKFLSLPPAERGLLLRAWGLVWAARLGLWLLPFAALRRWAGAAPARGAPASTDAPPVERLAWSVSAASRLVPRASCLTQALAGQKLLARHGHPARLHLGVARGDRGQFEAHAWLEAEGQIILGDRERRRFTPLTTFEGPR